MRPHWLSFVPLLFVVTCGDSKSSQTICAPGTEIFCRCRGGAPGTKLCADDGGGFGECRQADGECTEIPEVTSAEESSTTTTGGGVGGAGGAPSQCSHDLCEVGVALEIGCDECVTSICTSIDPFCCDKLEGQMGSWDAMCLQGVQKICGIDCGIAPSTSASSSSSSAASSSSGGPQCFPIDLLIPGDLVITELMNDSSSLSDAQGEYFEIYNTQSECLELKGLVIESQNDPKPYVIPTSLVLPGKSYALLCRDKNALAGLGVTCDHAYGGGINLGNSSDTLYLKAGILLLDGVAYGSSVIMPVGASRNLDPSKLDHKQNDVETNWCVSKSFISGSSGDRGTPGLPNDLCK
ncbi:MAG: lamin tail domain-containing protein [Deltaproteobacteria bacterium]|nr:lamin tail domain-containing protein [Deltaproteobacteria bacterium]